jgi:hypothetical protein
VFDFYKMSSEDVMGKGPTKGSKRGDEMVGCKIRVRRQELLCSFSARGKKGREVGKKDTRSRIDAVYNEWEGGGRAQNARNVQ